MQVRPAEPPSAVLLQGALQPVPGHAAEVRRPLHALIPDLLDQLEQGGGGEGGHAHHQLVDDAAQGPNVRSVIIGLLLYQLWSHVQRSPLNGS